MEGATGALGILIIFGVILAFYLVFYILVCTPLYLFMKKSNIRNAWLAYVPIANTYKQNHYLYDFFKYKSLVNNEITPEEYESKRRSTSLILTAVIMIGSFVLGLVMGFMSEPPVQTLEYTYGEMTTLETSPGLLVVNGVVMILGILYSIFIYMGMYKMVSKKPELQPKSSLASALYTVLTIITFGLSWVVQFFYYSISDSYDYYLNQYLRPTKEPDSDSESESEPQVVKGELDQAPNITEGE